MRLRRIMLSLLAAGAMTASTALVGVAPAGAVTTREGAFLTKVNNARAAHGLRPLRLSGDLSRTAKAHTRQMADARTIFHTASFSSICCWSAIAENIGVGYSVKGLHRALMHSATHRANILDRRMRVLGIGVVSSGGQLWVTELFTRPS